MGYKIKIKRAYVYYNLRKKLFSVRLGNKIVQHTDRIILRDCRFLVGKEGRLRVLQERRKNVHAGISGFITYKLPWSINPDIPVTYNPYKYESFVTVEDKQRVNFADYAVLDLFVPHKIQVYNIY